MYEVRKKVEGDELPLFINYVLKWATFHNEGRDRTSDLQDMSLTSFQLLYLASCSTTIHLLGLEPRTDGSEVHRSIQLSYRCTLLLIPKKMPKRPPSYLSFFSNLPKEDQKDVSPKIDP
jgi:hypothetical protein